MFVDDVYEDLELWYPKYRMIEEGFSVVVAGNEVNRIYKGKNGYPCKSDESYFNINENEFDGLIIPGGFAPDKLRREPRVIEITKNIFNEGKLVAHICHAGWIPISAQITEGMKLTSSPGIKDDLINSGADWIDELVVVDRNMISSRKPDDLPFFCIAIINWFKENK